MKKHKTEDKIEYYVNKHGRVVEIPVKLMKLDSIEYLADRFYQVESQVQKKLRRGNRETIIPTDLPRPATEEEIAEYKAQCKAEIEARQLQEQRRLELGTPGLVTANKTVEGLLLAIQEMKSGSGSSNSKLDMLLEILLEEKLAEKKKSTKKE